MRIHYVMSVQGFFKIILVLYYVMEGLNSCQGSRMYIKHMCVFSILLNERERRCRSEAL